MVNRKLLDIREQMRLDKTRTREEKEVYNLMKVVARFNTPENHEKLVQGIIKEKQIRQRIAELKELQSKGFRNWGDVELELESKKKKDDKGRKKDGRCDHRALPHAWEKLCGTGHKRRSDHEPTKP